MWYLRLVYYAAALAVLTPHICHGQYLDSMYWTAAGRPTPPLIGMMPLGVSHHRFAGREQHQLLLASPDFFANRADHRYEGAVIGAILFGGLAAYLVGGLCEKEKDPCLAYTVGAGLSFAFVGGITGLFIGRAIPKGSAGEDGDDPSSARPPPASVGDGGNIPGDPQPHRDVPR